MQTLNAVQVLALSKILTDKKVEDARNAVGPGMSLEVEPFQISCEGGKVVTGEITEYTPTAEIPLLDTLAIALHKSGMQSQHIRNVILDSAKQAISKDCKIGDEMQATIAYLKEDLESLRQSFASLPKKKRHGPMKVSVTWK